jgi:hypothetical protein
MNDRYMHKTRAGKYHVARPGEQFLADQVAALGAMVSPVARPH